MGIERNVSKPKGKVYSESKKSRRRQKKLTVVQKLYDTCKEVFADCGPGVVPSPDKVERLKAVLDTMTEIDVGLQPNMPYFQAAATGELPRITYLHLYDCDKFSIGIFCLPPTAVIPLHNHPEMTVFSKILFGTLHIKSYDWVKDGSSGTALHADPLEGYPKGGARLAKIKVDSEFTAPCNTSILYPADGGNMHCCTARTSCAFIDVLGPPYCDPEGRHCQYYLESPLGKFTVNRLAVAEEERDGYAWLEEREKPEDVTVVREVYNGPKIVKK